MAEPELSYCALQVRRHDRDRVLTCLFAPADRRQALFALYAFNSEVARTAEVVSEAMLGEIRLQWWRDSLAEIYAGTPRRHEVIEPLAAAVERHGLPRAPFERLLESRSFDLEPSPPESLAALESYAEATSASLLELALAVLSDGPAADGGPQGPVKHLGIAWALTGLARAVPHHARQKRLYLPRDLSEAAGLATGELFELRASPELSAVVAQVAARAGEHLAQARRKRAEIPKAARSLMLLGNLAGGHLKRLARAGHDPFQESVQAPIPGAAWRLLLASVFGRI